jgi:hypothetical protein
MLTSSCASSKHKAVSHRTVGRRIWRPPDPPEPEVRESTLALLAVVVLVILLAGGITGE